MKQQMNDEEDLQDLKCDIQVHHFNENLWLDIFDDYDKKWPIQPIQQFQHQESNFIHHLTQNLQNIQEESPEFKDEDIKEYENFTYINSLSNQSIKKENTHQRQIRTPIEERQERKYRLPNKKSQLDEIEKNYVQYFLPLIKNYIKSQLKSKQINQRAKKRLQKWKEFNKRNKNLLGNREKGQNLLYLQKLIKEFHEELRNFIGPNTTGLYRAIMMNQGRSLFSKGGNMMTAKLCLRRKNGQKFIKQVSLVKKVMMLWEQN